MTVCALAQMAAVMPHHHHSTSDAMCINPLHCLETHVHTDEGHGSENGCTDNGGHGHKTASLSAGTVCGDICGAHCCMHNTSGHRHTPDGGDCSVNHLDLNPPAKDKMLIAAPVLELACIFVSTFPPLNEQDHHGEHCTGGDVMCCSVYGGTLNLYASYRAAALPARAPSC